MLGNDHPITPAYRYFASDIEQRVYDPDKAKFHLKKAGLTELAVDLSASGAAFQSAVDAALLYKENAAKCGVNINVVREPTDGYWTNIWNKKPWCASYWFGTPDGGWYLYASLRRWRRLERYALARRKIQQAPAGGAWRARRSEASRNVPRHAGSSCVTRAETSSRHLPMMSSLRATRCGTASSRRITKSTAECSLSAGGSPKGNCLPRRLCSRANRR